jgi:hypothetical protein
MLHWSWACLILVLSCCATANAQKNLLFFGNSFTINNYVPDKVSQLAVADGYAAPLIVNDSQSGQTIAYHLDQLQNFPANNITHPSISGKTWDAVILQGYSTETTTALGNPAAFVSGVTSMSNLIRGHATGSTAEIVLYQTWARAAGHSYYPGTFATPTIMQSQIRNSYESALNNLNASSSIATIAPVGDAFQSLNFAPAYYASDLYHANNAGSLLSAMVLYRTIYDEQVSDIGYANAAAWAGVNETTWNQLVTLADSVAAVPEPGTWAIGLLIGAVFWNYRRLRVSQNSPTTTAN